MKNKLQILFGASAVSLTAFSSVAQDAYRPKVVDPSYHQNGMTNMMRKDRLNGAAKASDLIGMTVKNNQGVTLGKVDDLAVDVEAGRVVQVILSTGGFLGIGDTLSAVPPGALHHDVAKNILHLDADKAKLNGAPKFDESKWAENSDSNHVAKVYRHYNQQPWFSSTSGGDAKDTVAARNQEGKWDNSRPTGDREATEDASREAIQTSDAKGTVAARRQEGIRDEGELNRANGATNGASRRDFESNASKGTVAARENEDQKDVDGLNRDLGSTNAASRRTDQSGDKNNWADARNSQGNWSMDRMSRESEGNLLDARLGHVQKASELMGMAVRNLQDEKIGKVENLLVDISSGRLVAVIVSSGGFLRMNNELSAVPSAALRLIPDQSALSLDATKETLADAPHFKADRWPDFGQSSYSENVYRSYRIQPYFTTNMTTKSDNTAINIRDRGNRSLTPLDQGNSQQDIDTTAQIRKEIVAGKDMSVNAKNVKIITNQGRVTLRGTVDSAEEKRLIDVIANNVALAQNVDNQLDVK